MQQREAARQILANVSDIQAVVSLGGSHKLNLKLAAIRERAAFLFEGSAAVDKIIAGYQDEAQDALVLLSEFIEPQHNGRTHMTDAELIKAARFAEVFASRVNVYFDRKSRSILEGSDVD